MARQLQLDDREWIEITNSDGQVTGGFFWNPSDLDIVKRCEKVMDFFEHLEIPAGSSKMETIFLVSDAIKQQIDFLIPGSAETLFKNINPLSPRSDGTLFAEYVMQQLTEFIESELNIRMKKTTEKIKQYTEKYSK